MSANILETKPKKNPSQHSQQQHPRSSSGRHHSTHTLSMLISRNNTRTLVEVNQRKILHRTDTKQLCLLIQKHYLSLTTSDSYVINALQKKKSKTGYCRFLFHILSRYCECYINIFYTSVWCELLNHHDFIVSEKEHSLQWCHLLLLYLFPLFLLCLSLLQKQLSCQSQAFVFRITFTTIIFHHKEYGYIHTGSFIFLPAVGSRSWRTKDVVQTLLVWSHHFPPHIYRR